MIPTTRSHLALMMPGDRKAQSADSAQDRQAIASHRLTQVKKHAILAVVITVKASKQAFNIKLHTW